MRLRYDAVLNRRMRLEFFMPFKCFRIWLHTTLLKRGCAVFNALGVCLLLTAVLVATPMVQAAGQDVVYGELDASKPTLDGGEHYERYEFELQAGDRIVADVVSKAFDTFIAVVSPSGQDVQNDDWEEDSQRSRVALVADEAGTWTVLVTSFSAGEAGAFTLTVTINGPGELDDGTILPQDVVVPDGQRVLMQKSGHLGSESTRSPVRGEPYDAWEFEVEAGQQLTITMTSKDFDSFLAVFAPGMPVLRNDDGASDIDAQIVLTAEQAGTMTIHAASYDVEAVGQYQVVVTVAQDEPKPAGPVIVNAIDTTGRFARGDKTRDEGQFVKRYEVEAKAGDRIRVDMTSQVVDPHLFLTSPDGKTLENDDYQARIDQSVIETQAGVDGVYRVTASSFAAGETGEYRIVVTVTTPAPGSGSGVVPPTNDAPRDVPGALGGSSGSQQPEPKQAEPESNTRKTVGQLGDGNDQVAPTREFYDLHKFEARAGESYKVVLVSEAFDTYIEVTSPSDKIWENDDDGDNANQSALTITIPEDGEYTIKATSFYPQEKGDYVLLITRM